MKACIVRQVVTGWTVFFWVACAASTTLGDTFYVWQDSPTNLPGTAWSNAFHTIQDAVDAASDGDTVFVTNGVYDTGGAITPGYNLSNRVAVVEKITVTAVEGPEVTWITGSSHPFGGPSGNGSNAVRCAYLSGDAVLEGFTLAGGHTWTNGNWRDRTAGGVFMDGGGTLNGCVIRANAADQYAGGVECYNGGVLRNCLVEGNSAGSQGGGVECINGGKLRNCTIATNAAPQGSGALCFNGGLLMNCIVWSNVPGGADNIFISGTPPDIFYSCSPGLTHGVDGNITDDPGFVSADYGDYHLNPGSPCIDTGYNGVAIGTADVEGRRRIIGGTADMGCYEHVPLHAGPSATHYVSLKGGDVWPYTNWTDAAVMIQDAVDTAGDLDTVMVTNGVYARGGAITPGHAVQNRVRVTNQVTVASVSGPDHTTIVGTIQDQGTGAALSIHGGGTRGVFLSGSADLRGFTVTNGISASRVDPDVYNSGGGVWLDAGSEVSDCVIVGNQSMKDGGGVYGDGSGWVLRSVISGNQAVYTGGGASEAILANCRLTDNLAEHGGGAYDCHLYNCTILDNEAYAEGIFFPSGYGGGARGCTIYNSILLDNTAYDDGPNIYDCICDHCCTSPEPGGTGNFDLDPLFADEGAGDYQLRPISPCVNAGNNGAAVGPSDLVGRSRISDGWVDVGCFEYQYPGPTPIHYVSLSGSGERPYTNWATAAQTIQDAIDWSEDGDTVIVTNGVYDQGGAPVVDPWYDLAAMNRVHINDLDIALESVNGMDHTFIVGAGDPDGDAYGNGPDAVRCVWASGDVTIRGFTITGGHTWTNYHPDHHFFRGGGGMYLNDAVYVSHCLITNNYADYGGSIVEGTLHNCWIVGNVAHGGGFYGGTAVNCMISDNESLYEGPGGGGGGGTFHCDLLNCIVLDNRSAPGYYGPNIVGGTCRFSCTYPDPGGEGNVTGDPRFVDPLSGDYRFFHDSPCVDSGTNIAGITTDFTGAPRPLDGNRDGTATFDMGLLEYDGATADRDGDGRTDFWELDAGFNPIFDEAPAIAWGEAMGVTQGEENVVSDPGAYGLYTSNSIMDLDMGYLMLRTSNGMMNLSLQLQKSTNLVREVWTNAGEAVEWTDPAGEGKAFYRVRGGE